MALLCEMPLVGKLGKGCTVASVLLLDGFAVNTVRFEPLQVLVYASDLARLVLRARSALWLSRRALMRWVHRNRSVGIVKKLLGLCSF